MQKIEPSERKNKNKNLFNKSLSENPKETIETNIIKINSEDIFEGLGDKNE